MSDDEYIELQEALVNRPGMGDIIQGTGGLEKSPLEAGRTGKERWRQGDLLLDDEK